MYVIQMQEGCNAARSEAIKRVKDNTIRYLAAGRTPVEVDAHLEHKVLCGLNDPHIGRLLIPAEDLSEWDVDPDVTRAAFLSGIFTIYGVDMPVFLYEDYTYNPEDPEEGLFRGAYLTLIDILFGTNAVNAKHAKRNDQPRHHCVGEMYGLASISPENIAYGAVVARFCLSSKRVWNNKDDHFDYCTFYQVIVMRLADGEDPWVQDTIAWWNKRVFGNERGRLTVGDPSDERDEKWHRFVCRRAGRKAASKAVEARILAIERNPFTRDGSPSTPISRPSNRMIDPSLLVDAPLSPNSSINNDAVHGSPSAPIS
ncbi:hypothetical protein F5888DRAFT_1637981 [Russula emetica]|nr:hypothetical protein F5888DRAFT_1637981 [Russula emetica]